MKTQLFFFIFPEFDEASCARALAELRVSFENVTVRALAISLEPVISKGGLTVLPDLDFQAEHDLDDIDPLTTTLLLLPDGVAWEDKRNRKIEPLIRHCVYHQIPIAAIGAATIALADLGILNRVKHTSDHAEYLKCFSPLYDGDVFYSEESCCHDSHIVTAGSISGMEFCDNLLHLVARNVHGTENEYLLTKQVFPNN